MESKHYKNKKLHKLMIIIRVNMNNLLILKIIIL